MLFLFHKHVNIQRKKKEIKTQTKRIWNEYLGEWIRLKYLVLQV